MAPLLPPELINAIVDEFRDDRTRLMECSVVSKVWRASCRRHIFKSCSFIGNSADEALGLSSPYHLKLKKFVDFLERESYVGAFINSFSLSCTFVEQSGNDNDKELYHVDVDLLLQAVAKMPVLETLDFWQVCVVRPPMEEGQTVTPSSSGLTRLGFHWLLPHTDDSSHVSYLFELFPHVKDVHVRDCTFGRVHNVRRDGEVNERGGLTLPATTRIEVLDISDSRTPPFVFAALQTGTVDSLKSLYVQIPGNARTQDDIFHLKRLIHAAAPHLEDLSLKYETARSDFKQGEAAMYNACDDLVTPCTSLETLELYVFFGIGTIQDLSWRYVARILADLNSDKIQVVKLVVYSLSTSDLKTTSVEDWKSTVPLASLRESFASKRLKSILTVRFVETYESTDDEGYAVWKERELPANVQELLKKEFPVIGTKGVLKFDVVD